MRTHRRFPWSLVALAPVVAACAGLTPKPAEPTDVTVGYVVPKVTLVEAGQETQEQGSVVAKITPPAFAALRVVKTTCEEAQTFFVQNDQYNFAVTRTPSYDVRPASLEFKVKVINKMDRVLQLAGTIIKVLVNGEERTIPYEGYEKFLNGVLLPKQETEFTIVGPEWNTLPDDSALSFYLYDLPTAKDKAGVVTEKGNFEWNFRYTTQRVEEQDSVVKEERKMTFDTADAECENRQRGGV